MAEGWRMTSWGKVAWMASACLIVGMVASGCSSPSAQSDLRVAIWNVGQVPAAYNGVNGSICTPNTCLTTGTRGANDTTDILFSHNGGRSWSTASVPPESQTNENTTPTPANCNALTCLALGASAAIGMDIFRSTDGGASWSMVLADFGG